MTFEMIGKLKTLGYPKLIDLKFKFSSTLPIGALNRSAKIIVTLCPLLASSSAKPL